MTKRPQRKRPAQLYWLAFYMAMYPVCFAMLALYAGDLGAVSLLSCLVMALCGIPSGLFVSCYDGGELYSRPINAALLPTSAIVLLLNHIP